MINKKSILKQLKRSSLSSDESYSIPFQCYSNPDIFNIEISKLFYSNWICIGHTNNLKKPGDFFCNQIVGKDLIIIRDKDLKIRAFSNTCRHRGAKLLDGEGNTNVIRCPFHSWAYKINGTLAACPRMNEAKNFKKSENSLLEFNIRERSGFAFLSLKREKMSLDKQLGNFEEIHFSWPMKNLICTRRRSFEINCNWKIFLEVFNEHYHLPFVHPNTIGDIYNEPNQTDSSKGYFVSQFGDTNGTGALLEDEQKYSLPAMKNLNKLVSNGVRYTWLFPNLTFAIGRDAMWIYDVNPINYKKTQVTQTTCFSIETTRNIEFENKSKKYYYRMDAAIEEDVVALENQQQGLNSSIDTQGRFAPLLEDNVAAFANWYSKQMLIELK